MASTTSAGYSGTPLPRKLGIKPEARLALIGAPDGFDACAGRAATGRDRAPAAAGHLGRDLAFFVRAPSSSGACPRCKTGARPRRRACGSPGRSAAPASPPTWGRGRCASWGSRAAWSTTRCARSMRRGRGCGSSTGWPTAPARPGRLRRPSQARRSTYTRAQPNCAHRGQAAAPAAGEVGRVAAVRDEDRGAR